MKRFILTTYTQNFWGASELKMYENNELIEITPINKFFTISEDWIFIYNEIGGSGIGFKRGDIIKKIFIGDSEFEHITIKGAK